MTTEYFDLDAIETDAATRGPAVEMSKLLRVTYYARGLRKRAEMAPPWLADAAEALGEVRPEDSAPKALSWTQVLTAIRDMRDDRDGWKVRAEAAETEVDAMRQFLDSIREEADDGYLLGGAGARAALMAIRSEAREALGIDAEKP